MREVGKLRLGRRASEREREKETGEGEVVDSNTAGYFLGGVLFPRGNKCAIV